MRASRLVSALLLSALPLFASAQQLTVSAAASLTDAFKELGPQFEKAHSGATLRFNFAASGVLLQQIEQGAPVDVFASADQTTMDRAVKAKMIDEATRRDFVSNSLVLIEPAQGGHGIKDIKDLSKSEIKRIAVGKVDTVPVGRYTKEALESAGLWTSLQPKFVQADSVRQALDYVSRGEVDAGFVYRTDATIMGDKVKIALTAGGHTPVTYPVAMVADSKHKDLAKSFLEFLASADARKVLDRYGFGKP